MTTKRSNTDAHPSPARTDIVAGDHTNVAVLRGRLAATPNPRELPDGSIVVQFDVVTHPELDGRTISAPVPVAWYDPPTAWSDMLGNDIEVVVIGAVQRRFFRVGGATQSRTEVRARRVVPAGKKREVARLLGGVAVRLGAG